MNCAPVGRSDFYAGGGIELGWWQSKAVRGGLKTPHRMDRRPLRASLVLQYLWGASWIHARVTEHSVVAEKGAPGLEEGFRVVSRRGLAIHAEGLLAGSWLTF